MNGTLVPPDTGNHLEWPDVISCRPRGLSAAMSNFTQDYAVRGRRPGNPRFGRNEKRNQYI